MNNSSIAPFLLLKSDLRMCKCVGYFYIFMAQKKSDRFTTPAPSEFSKNIIMNKQHESLQCANIYRTLVFLRYGFLFLNLL